MYIIKAPRDNGSGRKYTYFIANQNWPEMRCKLRKQAMRFTTQEQAEAWANEVASHPASGLSRADMTIIEVL